MGYPLSSVMKSCAMRLHLIQDPQPSTPSTPHIQPLTLSRLHDPGALETDDPSDTEREGQ